MHQSKRYGWPAVTGHAQTKAKVITWHLTRVSLINFSLISVATVEWSNYLYIEDMLLSFDSGTRFCAIYNKRETEYHLCTIFKIYAHAKQLKNDYD